MNKFKNFRPLNSKQLKILKNFSVCILITIFIVLFYTNIFDLNLTNIIRTFRNQSLHNLILFFIFSLLVVSITSVYDFVLCKELNITLNKLDVFKIAWFSNTIGDFFDESTLDYPNLTYLLYKSEGIDSKKAKLISAIKALPFVKRNNIDINFSKLATNTKVKLVLACSINWVASTLFFVYIMFSFDNSTDIKIPIITFLISTIISNLSLIPGGIGIFELISLFIFSVFGVDIEISILVLIIYRLFYYIIPWIISMILLSLNFMKNKKIKISNERKRILNFIGINSLSALILFAGVSLIFNTTMYGLIEEFKFLPITIGCFLLILSVGIWHKVISSYYITFFLLLLGSMFVVVKNHDIFDSLILLIIAFVLRSAKGYFYRPNALITIKDIMISLLKVSIFSTLYVVLYNLINNNAFNSNNLIFNNNKLMVDDLFILIFIILSSAFLLALVSIKKDVFEKVTNNDLSKLEDFLQKYEGNSMTHLLFLKDKSLFYAANNQVLIGFRAYKDRLIVLGDPIGNSNLFNEAINEFRLYAHKLDMTPVFYEINEENLPIYHENGFNFLKLGEEAIINLENFSLVGKKWQDLRTIKNKMSRGEIEFELLIPPISTDVMNRLKEISDEWLGDRKEKEFSLGKFDEDYINLAPVGIVKKDGDIIAFVTIMPTYSDHTISIDLMRLIQNPPNGTMDALFVGVIDWAIANGYKKFILGKAPLSNVGLNQFSTTKEKIVKYIYNYGNKLYSFKGLRKYKEKYHPEWKGIYLAYPKNSNLSLIVINLTKMISGSRDN